uniref:Reticulon domain-containing protein n=1 Tax=Kalanchoe fedtschenkoi TaxID=63787 RepID=A0A7N0TDX9_KALFE
MSLILLSFLGAVSLHSLFVVALPIAFTAFYMYEKNEEEIDALMTDIRSFGCKLRAVISKKLAKPKTG